jgi:hypothetical protein
MGAAAIAAAPLILAGAGTAASMMQRKNAAEMQAKQFEIQRNQEKIGAADRGKQRAENINQLISSNMASTAAKGVSLASPSFKSINNAAFGKFQEDNKMDSLNLAGRLAYFDAQQDSVNMNAAYGMFSDLTSFGEKFFNAQNINKK